MWEYSCGDLIDESNIKGWLGITLYVQALQTHGARVPLGMTWLFSSQATVLVALILKGNERRYAFRHLQQLDCNVPDASIYMQAPSW